MSRAVAKILWIPLVFLLTTAVLALAAWNWLLHSQSGAAWLLAKTQAVLPDVVEVSRIQGDLSGGLHLHDVNVTAEGVEIHLQQARMSVTPGFFPITLELAQVELQQLTVKLSETSSQETGSDDAFRLESLQLPFSLVVSDLTVLGLRVLDKDHAQISQASEVHTTVTWHETLTVEKFHITEGSARLHAVGQLDLSAPYPFRLESGSSGRFPLPIAPADPQPNWSLEQMQMTAAGTPKAFNAELEASVQNPELGSYDLQLAAAGSGQDIELSRLAVTSEQLTANAHGRLQLQDPMALSLNAQLSRLDLTGKLEAWPQDQEVTGTAIIEWTPRQLLIDTLELNLTGEESIVSGQVDFDLDREQAQARLDWQDLQWPLQQPRLSSRTGSIVLSGKPSDWRLQGQLELQADDRVPGKLELSGFGSTNQLRMEIQRGSILDGQLAGEFALDWSRSLSWSAGLDIRSIKLEPLLPEWPLSLSSQLSAHGQTEPFIAEVQFSHLSGQIHEIDFEGKGGLDLAIDGFQARNLHLQSSLGELKLDGDLYQSEGLRFSSSLNLDRPGFEALIGADAGGSLQADGRVSLSADKPKLFLQANGKQLRWNDWSVQTLLAHANDNGDMQLQLEDLSGHAALPDSIQLSTSGGFALENISLIGQRGEIRSEISLAGRSITSEKPWLGWSGTLQSLSLEDGEELALVLRKPATLEFTNDSVRLSQTCLAGERGALLCFSGQQRLQRTELAADINSFPAQWLAKLSGQDWTLTQQISGEFDLQALAGQPASATVQLQISPGVIRPGKDSLDDDDIALQTGLGTLGFTLTQAQLSQGRLDFVLPDSGTVDIDFAADNLRSGMDSPIKGSLLINLQDVGSIWRVLPFFDVIDGSLSTDLALSGTLADPEFVGRVALRNGLFEHLASGIALSDINLAGNVSADDRSQLAGEFRAGDGKGQLELDLGFENLLSPELTLNISGEDLQIIDVPDLSLLASPDLTVNWYPGQVELQGQITVPSARLSPRFLPVSASRQSDDVVIVAGSLPGELNTPKTGEDLGVHGLLRVDLGDDIILDLDFADAKLMGGADFSWNGPLLPMADGRFDLTGEILAFGQRLSVSQGRITFPGIPADNPHLNIRAEREIYGNSQVRQAGLMVAGTLRRPVMEAYTVPMTNKHRAQTLLVTGSDFDFDKGVGAVDVGTYILPRLYISYGIGVFEDGNVLSARYDLNRRWGIKASSGQRDTGLDISYTIER